MSVGACEAANVKATFDGCLRGRPSKAPHEVPQTRVGDLLRRGDNCQQLVLLTSCPGFGVTVCDPTSDRTDLCSISTSNAKHL